MLTDEQIEQRRGNINASEVHNIMAGWQDKRPVGFSQPVYDWVTENKVEPKVTALKKELSCPLSVDICKDAWNAYKFDNKKPTKGMITYGKRLAVQDCFRYDHPYENVSTQQMREGNAREPIMFSEFSDATGLDVQHTGIDQLNRGKNGIRSTPDGLIKNGFDLLECGCEGKARNPYDHAEQLFIVDNASLLELDSDRYCQVQTGMYVFDFDYWYSISFNPEGKTRELRLHWAVIERDEKFISVLQERAEQVFEIKQEYLEKLSKVKRQPIREIEGIIA